MVPGHPNMVFGASAAHGPRALVCLHFSVSLTKAKCPPVPDVHLTGTKGISLMLNSVPQLPRDMGGGAPGTIEERQASEKSFTTR